MKHSQQAPWKGLILISKNCSLKLLMEISSISLTSVKNLYLENIYKIFNKRNPSVVSIFVDKYLQIN